MLKYTLSCSYLLKRTESLTRWVASLAGRHASALDLNMVLSESMIELPIESSTVRLPRMLKLTFCLLQQSVDLVSHVDTRHMCTIFRNVGRVENKFARVTARLNMTLTASQKWNETIC